MTRSCPQQSILLRALRSAPRSAGLPVALEAHRLRCQRCRQTAALTELLLTQVAALSAATQTPSPAGLWHRAQAERRTVQHATLLRRTSRLMASLSALSALYLSVLVAWSLQALWHAGPPLATPGLPTGLVLHATGLLCALLVSGALALLLLGRRVALPLL